MPSTHPTTHLKIAEVGDGYGQVEPVKSLPEPGFLNAREVFQHVLAHLWGSRADGDFDYPDDELCVAISQRLRRMEHDVHWNHATSCIRQAALDGEIEMLVETPSGRRRVPRERWLLGDDVFWEDSIWLSEFLPVAPLGLEDLSGHRLIFPEGLVVRWLHSLESEFVLPATLHRSSMDLPEVPTVQEAACWLAGQTARSFMQLSEERADLRALVNTIEDQAARNPGPDERDVREMAERQARLAVLGDACDLLLEAARSGELAVSGCWFEGSKESQEILQIPRMSLQADVKFDVLENRVLPAADATGRELDKALEASYWREVSFYRNELIENWGDNQAQLSKSISPTLPEKPGFSRSRLLRAYEERVKNWPLDQRHPSREDDEQWGKKEFNAPREIMRELRRDVAPSEWHSPGRPGEAT